MGARTASLPAWSPRRPGLSGDGLVPVSQSLRVHNVRASSGTVRGALGAPGLLALRPPAPDARPWACEYSRCGRRGDAWITKATRQRSVHRLCGTIG